MVKKIALLDLLILISSFAVNAGNIESHKVYRINNIGYPGNVLSISGSALNAIGSKYDAEDLKQMWYLSQEGEGYYFRNVSNGAFLTSPKEIYTTWFVSFISSPDDTTMLMTIEDYDGNQTIRALSHDNNYSFAHNDGNNNIVCWLNTSQPSQWCLEEVEMSSNEIEDILNRFQTISDEIARAGIYEKHLDELFIDKACTKLKVSGDLSTNQHYKALPPVLQNMVDKVTSGNWLEEQGDWDSEHARKYRIQLYEPYSEGASAASLAGVQAYTNMNNPTGIIGYSGDILYVMVDDEIPEGATLYISGISDCNMHNNPTEGVPLKRGLNIIYCDSDLSHYFIYYTVNTVKDHKPAYSLKDFNPITIHIEGGSINGFFNYVGDDLYTPDSEADFRYTIQRAKHPMFDLLGRYTILHFFLEDTPDTPEDTVLQKCVRSSFDPELNPGGRHYDPVITLKAWDDMCFSERILMGIQSDEDIKNPFNQGFYESIVNEPYEKGGYNINQTFEYSDYFNNRMMGITLQAKGLYMNATSWRTAYAPGTVSVILTQFPEDGIWGPAHEYGHINQTPIRIAGTTEESNNLFSNVANYFLCGTTSRCDYPEEQLKTFNQGKTYLENGTWGTTRMFWQLWCYYHATKHNTKFYPRLFELLRKYPLVRYQDPLTGKLNPKTDLLHFAKMCCIASGEDLTDFFTSWGFFVPQDNYHIDDYDVYDCILTEEDINSVKNEIAEMHFPVNKAIILIDDRVGSSLPQGFGYDVEKCGKYGGITDFANNKKPTGKFSYIVEENKVTVNTSGHPGAGYLVYSENYDLLGFSNTDSFILSDKAAQALLDGSAFLMAVGTDNSFVIAVNLIRDGSNEEKKLLLNELIETCEELLKNSDPSLSKVGSFIPSECETLESIMEDTRKIYNDITDSSLLTELYIQLYKAYFDLVNDDNARIKIEPGAAYRFINYHYDSRSIELGEKNLASVVYNDNNSIIPFSRQWIFETDGEKVDSYYIKNLSDGRYIGNTKTQSAEIPLDITPQSFKLISLETQGVYALSPDGDERYSVHIDGYNNIVQWNSSSLASQWRLVKTASSSEVMIRQQLKDYLEESKQLLETCGSLNREDACKYIFENDKLYTNAPYLGNNYDRFLSWDVLFDNDISTYFHSNYDNAFDSEDGLDHYIRIEAPEDQNFRFFNLSYITRENNNTGTNPKSILIEASSDLRDWKVVYQSSGLKIGSAVYNDLGEIYAPEGTRFIRFMVTGGNSTASGHPYFCLSELTMENLGEPSFLPDETYPGIDSKDLLEINQAILDCKLILIDPEIDVNTLTQGLEQLRSVTEKIRSKMFAEPVISEIKIVMDSNEFDIADGPQLIRADVFPENATMPELVWSVEDDDILQMEPLETGLCKLTPLIAGETLIKVFLSSDSTIVDSKNIVITDNTGVPLLFEADEKIDVYNPEGHIVIRNADENKLKELPPGIYIIRQGKISKSIFLK